MGVARPLRGLARHAPPGPMARETRLALFGLPLAQDMDGAPATEIFQPGYLPAPPAPVASYDDLVPPPAAAYDLEHVRERLRGLGYVE